MDFSAQVETMISHFEAGEVLKAEPIAISIISVDSRNGSAWYVLGMAALQDGRYSDAEQALHCVNKLSPENLDAWLRWQESLLAQKKFQEVADNCVKAIQRCWDIKHFETYFRLPTDAKTSAVASLLKASLLDAISKSEKDATLWLLLARFYLEDCDYERASNSYLMATACSNSDEVLAAYGAFLHSISEYSKAIKVFLELVERDSMNVKHWIFLGSCYHTLSAFELAVEAYEKADEVDPGNLDVCAGLSTCVAASNSDYVFAAQLLKKIFASIYESNEAMTEAQRSQVERRLIPQRAQLTYYQQHLAQYDDQSQEYLKYLLTEDNIPENKIPPPFHVMPIIDSPELLKRTAAAFKPSIFKRVLQDHEDPTARRIKVGWFGGDFHDHATMVLLNGVFREYDRNQFDFRVFSYGGDHGGDYRKLVQLYVDDVYELYGKNDVEITRFAQDLKLDIAIDLKGFTRGGRTSMFSAGLAPIQISYLGWPGTSGKDYMDYMIADEQTIPEKLRDCYTESIMYMPNSYQPNDNQRPISWEDTSRQYWGLPDDGVVFASFNQLYKARPDELAVWASLLSSVEGSVLWLMVPPNKQTAQTIRDHFVELGIDAKRIVMAPQIRGFSAHISRIRHADIFLDCFIVNGHTTISDCLFAGVPAVTMPGRQFPARVGASLLRAAGLEELIASDRSSYFDIALKLALDVDYRQVMRARCAGVVSSSSLFDTKKYVCHLEELFKKAFDRSCNGLSPVDLYVK